MAERCWSDAEHASDVPNVDPEDVAHGVGAVGRWLDERDLLTEEGRDLYGGEADRPPAGPDVGLYRPQVKADAAEFFDTCFDRWFGSSGMDYREGESSEQELREDPDHYWELYRAGAFEEDSGRSEVVENLLAGLLSSVVSIVGPVALFVGSLWIAKASPWGAVLLPVGITGALWKRSAGRASTPTSYRRAEWRYQRGHSSVFSSTSSDLPARNGGCRPIYS